MSPCECRSRKTSFTIVQKLLGHKNVATTEIYSKLTDERKRQSVNRITLKPSKAKLRIL